RLALWMMIAMVTLMPHTTLAGPAEEGAATIDRWVAAYTAHDVEALIKIYTPDAILQGTSEPQINVGSDDLRKYWRNLPTSGGPVTIQERHMVVINDTTVLAVGFYTFRQKARFSFLIVKRGDEWRIAHHHSSSIPKGRP